VKETVRVRPATLEDEAALLKMFCSLWPDGTASDHGPHLRAILRGKPLSTLPLVIFVARRGAKLIAAAERWCRAQGCREMGSDTWTTNRGSIAAHRALGYEIDCRCVNFRKSL